MPAWLVALLLFGLCYAAAWRYGVDSRDGQDWWIRRGPAPPVGQAARRAHSPSRDLAVLRRAVRRIAAEAPAPERLIRRPTTLAPLRWRWPGPGRRSADGYRCSIDTD
ncbi:hypothetical protein PA7_44340 [Pseudonocardia asaccharolytica DSM 44247 = NBRC 16224]|uniref:Uncharacterized protein n=1 Tax=Pseudonocardia asaccharolytica DSM 44247 = NBRC 16224 TaxID=1123024 RepID=A0A511D7K6_9PSEU|nr:hypothetical protein PA7_44340 [Pseudonocardia asaccharolytica DSM 44247 = NBRC 16224]